MKKKALAYLIISAVMISSMTGCVKIVKQGEEASLLASESTEEVVDFNTKWKTTIIPGLEEQAVDLSEFLTKANGNIESLSNEYGKRAQADSAVSFTVKGSGEVVEINTESRGGYIKVKLDDYNGSEVIKLQIGPVFKGTAVRDSSYDVKFEDYKNQVDYAAVSKNIHDIISETIIGKIDIESLKGKSISFEGCFTLDKNDELVITPISILEK